MKKTFIAIAALICLASCATKDKKTTSGSNDTVKNSPAPSPELVNSVDPQPVDTANMTTIEWIDPTVKNMGTMKKNKAVEITFRFRNTGNKHLVISNVTAACGCTVPEKPEKPFAPGEEGVIKATFNGIGSGMISKNVTVTANTNPSQHVLVFNGELKD